MICQPFLEKISYNLPYEKVGNSDPVCIADEVPFEIPDSWEWVRLSQVVYNRGQMTPAEKFCYIDIGSIDNKNQKLNKDDTVISPEKAPSRARKIVDIGDILYSTVRPYLHNMCIIDRQFSCQPIASTGFAALTCHTGYYNEYLFYYLMSPDFDSYANDTDNAKGVAYPAINDEKLYKALIPVPPKAEQVRIVDKIKELRPYIDKYGEKAIVLHNLNSDFPNQLKKSILQEAVQGKLVPQDENDEPASVLLERIRQEKDTLVKAGKIKKDKHESVISRRDNSHYEKRGSEEVCIDDELPFEIPASWQWERLINIYNFIDYRGATPNKITSGVPLITAKNVKKGYIDYTIKDFISVEEYKNRQSRGISNKGDILFTTEAPLGNVAIADIEQFSAGQRLITFQQYSKEQQLNNELIMYFILSECFQKQLQDKSTGTTVKGIKADKLKRLFIPIPPQAEQSRILASIQLLVDKTSTL